MAGKIRELVIIDPQNDFCDPKGSLFVKGANEDMTRLAKFVDRFGSLIDDINITLDSHQDIDIAHPTFWQDGSGKNPSPFTVITADDVNTARWMPNMKMAKFYRERAVKYVNQLAANGRYPLVVWPVHCVIGSWGYDVYPELLAAVRSWGVNTFSTTNFVTKGSNPHTEHYSAIKAEVPDPEDTTTQVNSAFIEKLIKADEIIIAGEALSHCVANTFRDVAQEFGNDEYIKKMILLKDASSNVPTFDALGDAFIKDMTAKGMRVTTTTDYVA